MPRFPGQNQITNFNAFFLAQKSHTPGFFTNRNNTHESRNATRQRSTIKKWLRGTIITNIWIAAEPSSRKCREQYFAVWMSFFVAAKGLNPRRQHFKNFAGHRTDDALAEELLADEKELAEHLMLLDLGRNDVGRVAKIGTVEVTEKMVIERYSHVMHIVSNVEAEIDDKHDAMDALIGGFPAGTVSGAPKIRAMEIIDELEKEKRGIYAGTVGYFSANGSMDTCIVLRIALVKDGTMYVQSGAGIVTDSDPESEHRECQNKALALIRAAEEAVRYAGDRSGNQPR